MERPYGFSRYQISASLSPLTAQLSIRKMVRAPVLNIFLYTYLR